jgi:hypothetical protein
MKHYCELLFWFLCLSEVIGNTVNRSVQYEHSEVDGRNRRPCTVRECGPGFIFNITTCACIEGSLSKALSLNKNL